MPSDEYASAAGGALRLKGAKVEKHKKKHKHGKHKHRRRETEDQLAKALDGAGSGAGKDDSRTAAGEGGSNGGKAGVDDGANNSDPYANMTAAERAFAEAQERKIRDLMMASPEEARAAHPELFKSHKERLADLNAYLSRMSEHHDMPKIGPG